MPFALPRVGARRAPPSGGLRDLGSPVLRLPGGDSLNTWSYARGPMHAGDFLTLARAGDSTPLWGVNVTTAKPADTEAFAQTLEGLHSDPAYCELDNELYLRRWASHGAASNPSATDWNPPRRLDAAKVERGLIRVPPNSVTVVTLP